MKVKSADTKLPCRQTNQTVRIADLANQALDTADTNQICVGGVLYAI